MNIKQIITDYIRRSILTTQGDLVVRGAAIPERLAAVALGQVLKSGGVGALPAWGVERVIIDIDDWDMDATPSVSIAHGQTFGNIRSVFVLIRDDLDVVHYPLTYDQGIDDAEGHFNINSANVNLSRPAGSFFDSVNFDSTSYNRGWITIWLA